MRANRAASIRDLPKSGFSPALRQDKSMGMRVMMDRWRALVCAVRGLRLLIAGEPHARLHALATLAVALCAVWLGCGAGEWALLLLAIALVWSAEACNASIERLADRVQPERDPAIRDVKDLAAGGVLAAAVGAALIGLLVLGPRLWEKLGRS